ICWGAVLIRNPVACWTCSGRCLMPDDLQRLERELRSLVADGVRRGLSSAEIRQQVSRLIATSKAPQVLRDQMLRDAERQAQFLSDTRMPPPDRDTLARITVRASSSFAQMQGAIDGRVARIIEDGLRRERSAQDMENRIAQVMGGVQYRAATVTSTALSAYNRTATMHGATQLGIERFRYAGPRGEREFCRAHVGKVFTADEIAQMDNGQGLPVKTYCGGYNCRHHWEPIAEKPADMPRQQPLQFGPAGERDPLTAAHFGGESHVEADYGTRGFESMVLGQSMTHQQRSRLAGAPSGSHVVVQPAVSDDGMDGVHMSVSHPMYAMTSQRVVFRATDGNVELHNDLLVIRPDAPPGFGARVFATRSRRRARWGWIASRCLLRVSSALNGGDTIRGHGSVMMPTSPTTWQSDSRRACGMRSVCRIS
ncbi:MAG TPA: hypothetical protein VHI13_06040, partial [Candidatus Kapabacteria bacterium]|nr:hypothetical protein [Candidatus Kapabacteria bacterium]